MQIQVNGEPREVAEGATLSSLVADLRLEGSRYAIEVNEELVPRSEHARHRLQEGDRVEVVQAIGGG
ncbi:MAG TPA: sulfur carrier protein ThiS [Thiolapillus brandeum]|uniref:Sulfur carrier protein ThiS n=1 Tax=Thiolapillus brandeum TaxID=1076588 RepID=A0A7C5N374_9GAMM|nr:sulfur carrier protein ThiS [Thiolapillus brandeum]